MMLLLMHGDGSGPADPKTRTGVPFSCHATGCYWISHERRLLQKSSSESVLAAVAGVPPVLEASSSASAAKSGERRKVLWKGPVSPLEVARKAVLYSTACSRVASHDFDVVRSFNPDADPRVQAMTSPLGRSAPWSVMGLATLLGMLCVDWVFDTGDSMQEAKVYYCALLPTLFSFPQCLRILIPVAFSGVHILMNLSGPPGARVAHLATCAVLLFGGLPCFYISVRAVQSMCSDADMAKQMNTLQRAHAALFVIFLASIALETAGHAARTKPKEQ
eukprot:s6821_g2.t1